MAIFKKSKKRTFYVNKDLPIQLNTTQQVIEAALSKSRSEERCSIGATFELDINRNRWEVEKLVCDYHQAPIQDLKSPKGLPLKGFNVDPEDLETLVNPASAGLHLPRACNIFISFAKRRNDFTIIFFRVDGMNEILWDIAYEFCLPCPDTCPNQLTPAHSSYICK